jgi:dTDP-4-dehydrorhamnose 3,5-epimerase
MHFTAGDLAGVWMIDVEPRGDPRGFLARTYSVDTFAAHGLCTRWVQTSTVFNPLAGTLRGMHLQHAPAAEVKVVRCTAGRVYDVILDLRPHSPTFRRWSAVELSADNRRMVYIPEGLAHGMQTLEADSELFYMMSEFYTPAAATGVRWNDPAFAIEWPSPPATGRMIAPKDQEWPDFHV